MNWTESSVICKKKKTNGYFLGQSVTLVLLTVNERIERRSNVPLQTRQTLLIVALYPPCWFVKFILYLRFFSFFLQSRCCTRNTRMLGSPWPSRKCSNRKGLKILRQPWKVWQDRGGWTGGAQGDGSPPGPLQGLARPPWPVSFSRGWSAPMWPLTLCVNVWCQHRV